MHSYSLGNGLNYGGSDRANATLCGLGSKDAFKDVDAELHFKLHIRNGLKYQEVDAAVAYDDTNFLAERPKAGYICSLEGKMKISAHFLIILQ